MGRKHLYGKSGKISLMIDGDNVSPKYIDIITDRLAVYSSVAMTLIYGNWNKNKSWPAIAQKYKFIIRPLPGNGKNSADMQLIIDAMDICHCRPEIGFFAIVTHDGDFAPLARRLRHHDRSLLIGMGTTNAATNFIKSVDTFIFLPDEPPLQKRLTQPDKQKLNNILTEAFKLSQVDKAGWVQVGTLGIVMRQVDPSFEPQCYGFSNLSKLLNSVSVLEPHRHPDGQLQYRFKVT
jgi:uncharacterized LabA/DUF88 family protein